MDEQDHNEDEQRIDEQGDVLAECLILGRNPTQSLRFLHPTVPQAMDLWLVFLANVDPIVKIFHVPSTQRMIFEAVTDIEALTPAREALLFAVYLSAVTSLNDEECERIMGEHKQMLRTKLSNATQQALVNAEFLRCTDLTILQALTLYLVSCLLWFSLPRYVWLLIWV